jgi:hypothetical protein
VVSSCDEDDDYEIENADDDDDYVTDDERVRRSPKRRRLAVPTATVTEEVNTDADVEEQNDVYTLTVRSTLM